MKECIRPCRIAVARCSLLLLAFAGGTRAVAGPLPMPLEAQLDLADHVIVGQLTQMQETDVKRGDGIRWGIATVAVRETLKGQVAKTLSFLAASWVDPNYGGSSPPHVYKNGDSGIWLIMPGGTVDHTYGRLDGSRKNAVEQILKSLAAREWSADVDGLKAWAGVVQPNYHPNPVILFAIKNVSNANIQYPISEVVSASAESPDKSVFNYPASPQLHGKMVFCRKISPGETVYLHPDYSFIDLAWKLKLFPGVYMVSVTYQNDRDGETATGPAEGMPVKAWKGELKAPAVKLVLSGDKMKELDAQPIAPADADKPRR